MYMYIVNHVHTGSIELTSWWLIKLILGQFQVICLNVPNPSTFLAKIWKACGGVKELKMLHLPVTESIVASALYYGMHSMHVKCAQIVALSIQLGAEDSCKYI